jgi:hypothetical protein
MHTVKVGTAIQLQTKIATAQNLCAKRPGLNATIQLLFDSTKCSVLFYTQRKN